jgi:integrase
MARPREHNVDIPNLYRKFDKRNGKVYWQYFNQLDGKFASMGCDEILAKTAALELNRVIAQKQVEHAFSLVDSILGCDKADSQKLRLHDWIDKYLDLLDRRLERKELALKTINSRKSSANLLRDKTSNMYLENVGAREMAAILDSYKDEDKNRTASIHRSNWVDLFKEAQYAGEVIPGFNPALATRQVSCEVLRSRLYVDQWHQIFEEAKNCPHYACCSLLLALVTGQRVGDIAKMKFSDVWDEYLHIEQEKTGRKIALPLTLYCDAVSMDLGQVIEYCRDKTLSHYLVHHTTSQRRSKIGGAVNKVTLSKVFSKLRDQIGIVPDEGRTPSTFHEQRSLSERLYRKQGIDTQILLGHSAAAMTAKYNDDRKNDWVKLAV